MLYYQVAPILMEIFPGNRKNQINDSQNKKKRLDGAMLVVSIKIKLKLSTRILSSKKSRYFKSPVVFVTFFYKFSSLF